jgi:hypothetical protein
MVTKRGDDPFFACPTCGEWWMPQACPRCKMSFLELSHPWSAREIAQFSGVSDRTVQHWRQTGVIGPTHPFPPVEPDRVYGFADAVAHKMFEDLLKARVPRVTAFAAAEDILLFAGRWMLESTPQDYEDEESWAKSQWVIVPLTEDAAEVDRPRGQSVLISYGEYWEPPGLPTAAELTAWLEPGVWVYPIGGDKVAYPLVLAIREVADRVDAYVKAHHLKPGELWDFQLG